MKVRHTIVALWIGASVLPGCADGPGEITRDTQPFDGIGSDATVSLAGTEPFWNMTVEPSGQEYRATYSTPQDIDGSTFAVSRFAGNNGVGFSGELDGRTMQIAVSPGECSDGMTDRSYPYTATVVAGDETLYGCAHTSEEPFSGSEMP